MVNWLLKHAPKRFDELAAPELIQESFLRASVSGDPPHLLISGSAGVGKTAAWRLVARQVLGPGWRATHHVIQARDLARQAGAMSKFEEFLRPEGSNSSDTLAGRLSLDAFDRMMIPAAASDPPPAGEESIFEGQAPISRLIIIEDADHLGPTRQPYLRRVMEVEGVASRFILTARSPSRLIDALRSRTSAIRIPTISNEMIEQRLGDISKSEQIDTNSGVIGDIVHISTGNMRKAIFTLQLLSLRNLVNDRSSVHRIVSAATMQQGRQMLELALRGRVVEWRWEDHHGRRRRRLVGALGEVDSMMLDHALDAADIIHQLHRILTSGRLPLPDSLRTAVIDALARCDTRLNRSMRPRIQLERFLHEVAAAGAKHGLVMG